MDLLERFSSAWCDTCQKVQPVILGVMEADDKNDHEAADIICDECKSILVTLHAVANGCKKAPPQDGASGGRSKGRPSAQKATP